LRSRADQLEVSREMISEIAGLPERYANKVLSLKGERRIGMQSLGSLLGALGLKLIAVEDTAALERNRTRYEACDAAHVTSARARWNPQPERVPRSRRRK
jgi:hypothetical protein